MIELFKLMALSLVGMFLILSVRQHQPAIAILLLLMVTLFLFQMIFGKMTDLFTAIHTITNRFHLSPIYIETILKMLSISYLIEWTSHMMKDAGLATLALKVELAGKWMILILAIPIIQLLLEMILQFVPKS